MWTLAQLSSFEETIDVRSPAEYDLDHIPGALNYPVLNDEQRAEVGKIYKRISSLEAKKCGAAMVTENIAKHLKDHFRTRDESWRPLVYCWRGGMRSAAFTHVLREIGWQAEQLPGGYKAYRKAVIDTLTGAPPAFGFKVLCGCTGTGKSRLLGHLARQGAQVLDLEALANHRGSVLGAPTTGKQPAQKQFESWLCKELRALDPSRTVYVEAESRRIGKIHVPDTLLQSIRSSECVNIEASIQARIRFLISEYRHFLHDDALLKSAIQPLRQHAGKNNVENWLNWRNNGGAENLVQELLRIHYDPLYLRSIKAHFNRYESAVCVQLKAIDDETLDRAAQQIMALDEDLTRSNFRSGVTAG